ncbi:MAG: PAS domain-containing protein [Anaerolineae bacterium]|nr:PAS domain-containing protein [Anaerolineae bacterium]
MELLTSAVETMAQLNERHLLAAFLVIGGLAVVAIALRAASAEWEAREALEQRYAALMENVAEGVMLVRASDGQIIEANHPAARLAGREVEELRGTRVTEVFPTDGTTHWLKEVRALGRASLTAVSLRRKPGSSVPVDIEAITLRQGRERIVQLILRPVAPPSHPEPRSAGSPATGAPVMPALPAMPTLLGAKAQQSIPVPVSARMPADHPVAWPSPAGREERSAVRQVLAVVAQHYKVAEHELTGTRNTPELTLARRVAMYLALNSAGADAKEAGQALGARSEVAVTYGARYVADAMEQDWALRKQVEELTAQLGKIEPTARARRA